MATWTPVLARATQQYEAPNSPSDPLTLDAILYINLAARTDRRRHIEQTIEWIRPLTKHVERIDAVKHPNGGKGCALSHLKAFRRILDSEWDTVLILEDDATLDMQPRQFKQSLHAILQVPFDAVVCGSEIFDRDLETNTAFSKLTDAQCTTAYLIRRSYVPVLQTVWQHCVDHLSDALVRKEYRTYAIDQAWKQLFVLHEWLWFCGNPFRQQPGYSDIERRDVAYKWNPRTLTDPIVPLP